jgi:type I restriction enzyme S subunit
MKPLEEVCNVEYGTRVVQKRDGGKGFPVYGGGGATFEMDVFNREDRLVVARFGMSEECTRFVAGQFYLNDSGLTVSPKNGAMHQRFLDYQMLALNDDIYALGKGTAQKNLDVPVFRTLLLFVPESLAEQQRIVGLLDEALEDLATAKANAETNLQNARALFESHLQSVFTQRGSGWVKTRLADICERVSVGHVGPTSEFYCDPSEGIPFLRSQNVRPGKLDWEGVQYITKEFHGRLRKSQIRFGDLLFVRVGANRGDCCAVLEDVAELNCANIVFARPTRGNAAYLERYCQSPPGRAQLLGMTTGSAQGVINTKSVAELVVPMPEEAVQEKVVTKLDELHQETQCLARLYERKLAALEALKKSLLHQAFNGEL